MTRAPSARAYCFTWNNYSDVTVDCLYEFFDKCCTYLVVGKEVAPTTGTPHLQGYFHLSNPKTMSAVHKSMSQDGIALLVARGDAEANYEYCSKGGDFAEWGQRPSSALAQCKLNSEHYAECIQFAKDGNFAEIEAKYPKQLLQYYHTFHRIHQDSMQAPPALDGVCGEWWWGPPGTGKSHKAFELGCYDKEPNKWFGGYNGVDPIVIQDLDHDNAKWMGYHLKKWADKYPFTAEAKGRQVSIRPPKVIVTSNYTIRELFSDSELIKALERRFKVTHFNSFFQQN